MRLNALRRLGWMALLVSGLGAASAAAKGLDTTKRSPFQTNLAEEARENVAYRHVIYTGAKTQIALMTIPPNGDIGMESHPKVEQLIFIVSGEGKAVINGADSALRPGDVVVATPGVQHDVVNTGSEPLHLYTIYAPPNHIDGRVHATKADAAADSADEAFGRSVH